MLWVALIISSLIFGCSLIMLIRRNVLIAGLFISIGWCLGTMITGSIFWIISIFSAITPFIALIVAGIEVLIAFPIILMIYRQFERSGNRSKLKISAERNPYFYMAVITIGITTLYYSNKVYQNYPESLPESAVFFFEVEESFISSVIYGVNAPRKHWFLLEDPLLMNNSFALNSFPLFYCAGLQALGMKFQDLSYFLSFVNGIVAASSIFYLGQTICSGKAHILVIIVLLNGGFAFYKNFIINDQNIDLIHNTGRGAPTPFYQNLLYHIIFSKISSFVFPMVILAIALISSNQHSAFRNGIMPMIIIAGLLISFCPSMLASISFFIYASTRYSTFIQIMPFAVFVIPKLIYAKIEYEPIWREYQMNGIFYSQIQVFIDSFGFPFLSLVFIPVFFEDPMFIHKILSSLATFTMLFIIREGNDHIQSSLALATTVYPFLCALLLNSLAKIRKTIGNKTFRGIFLLISLSIIITYVAGSFITMNREINKNIAVFDEEDQALGIFAQKVFPKNHPILINIKEPKINPVSVVAGRQLLIGNPKFVFRYGGDFAQAAVLLSEIGLTGMGGEIMKLGNINYLVEDNQNLFILKNSTQAPYFKILNQYKNWSLYVLNSDIVPDIKR